MRHSFVQAAGFAAGVSLLTQAFLTPAAGSVAAWGSIGRNSRPMVQKSWLAPPFTSSVSGVPENTRAPSAVISPAMQLSLVVSASLMVSCSEDALHRASRYYKLHVNGEKVSNHELGAFTTYTERVYYDTW